LVSSIARVLACSGSATVLAPRSVMPTWASTVKVASSPCTAPPITAERRARISDRALVPESTPAPVSSSSGTSVSACWLMK
jgi:hypothetical protein